MTTIIARVCLDILRSRKSRREAPLDSPAPDEIRSRDDDVVTGLHEHAREDVQTFGVYPVVVGDQEPHAAEGSPRRAANAD